MGAIVLSIACEIIIDVSKTTSIKLTEQTFIPLSIVGILIASFISGSFWLSGLSKEVQLHEQQIVNHTESLKDLETLKTAMQDIKDIKQLLRDQEQVTIKRNERIYNQINELKESVYKIDGKLEILTETRTTKEKN